MGSEMCIRDRQIRVKWTLSTYGDDLDESTIGERIALWEKVNQEDREKLERMQGQPKQYDHIRPYQASNMRQPVTETLLKSAF